MDIIRGITGTAFLVLVCYLFSTNRKKIDWKLVATGVLIQLIFALAVLKVDFIRRIFEVLAAFFVKILEFTKAGSTFLFGNLITDTASLGYIFAFQVLPTVIFFSALTSLLYYLGILQRVVYGVAWVMSKTMKISGTESLNAAGNIFLGQTEAPLLIKPYLEKMTRSEILCVMVGGMATIAGGVLAAYIGFLGGPDPQQQKLFATHLLTASIMSAPAAIVAAKMLFPQTEEIDRNILISNEKIGSNVLEAIANGTTDGLKLAVNVGAMLLVFTAFIYMFNFIFFKIGDWTNVNEMIVSASGGRYNGLSLQLILGYIFSPVAWMLGTSAHDMVLVGQLLGEKTILNEFYAYTTLGNLKQSGLLTDQKSILIATYALCGFSNFASIGIQIGGIGSLAPNQRRTLSELGLRAVLGGTIACLMTASIAGMLF